VDPQKTKTPEIFSRLTVCKALGFEMVENKVTRIVITESLSKLLKHISIANRNWAPAYSQALRRIKWVVQKVVHGRLRSDL